jgi:hypothetical protein
MKANTLFRKLTGVSVVTKSRCGFLVALVAIVAIGGEEAITAIGFLNRNDSWVCIGVGALGFLFWLAGWARAANAAQLSPAEGELAGLNPDEHPLAFLTNLKYWGLILILATGVICCFISWNRREQPVIVHARPLRVVTVTVTNVVTVTNQAPKVSWPALRLQGVVVNGARSSAVINRRVLCLGESISNVVLVAVSPGYAEVALQGETRVLMLRR